MSKNELVPFALRPNTLNWFALVVLILSAVTLGWQLFNGQVTPVIIATAGLMFTFSAVLLFRAAADPDSIRAHQTDEMLKLSRQTLACLQGGFNEKSAQKLCDLLFPSTDAVAVAITNREIILGYTGVMSVYSSGYPVGALSVLDAMDNGEECIIESADEIGLSEPIDNVQSAIIIPLMVGRKVEGSLVFLFGSVYGISSTQKSIAEGFGQLVSTQLAAEALEEQQKLATSMELKALQSQINPHFLFNTINTIASLVRTDPAKARTLLRDFAVFYRRTLDDSQDLIPLKREVEQVVRYFSFEVARFGEERTCLEVDIPPEAEDLMVPPFLLQPLVENSVQHAMPSEGKLTVKVGARMEGENAILWVADDGVGMSEKACKNILSPDASSENMGIAVKNVHDRMCGYFGPGTHMEVSSELGEGTTVRLHLNLSALDEFAN